MKKALVIPKSYLPFEGDNLGKITTKSLLSLINTKFEFMSRDIAETDENYLQIIPYIIVKQDNKIFTYTRLSKGTETRLHSNMSIGIGGHIDDSDLPLSLYNSGSILVENAAYRELDEELDIELNSNFLALNNSNIIIYDPSNAVGRVHLGIVYICDVSGRLVSVKETDKIAGTFLSTDEIKTLYELDSNKFETWSQIVIKQLKIV